MSELERRFLRSVRMGGTITLGMDGRPRTADDPLSGIVGGTPEEMQAAVDIVEEAQRRADDLVRQAALEAISIRDRARSVGYEQGYQSGAAEARGELAEALALVQAVAAAGKAARDDLLRRSEREMVEMVTAGLRAVVGVWAEQEPVLIDQTVRRALERAGAQNVVRLRVHPGQADAVTASLTDAAGAPPAFEILGDGSISIGGCVIDTAHGRVDARLDVQLDAIAQLLREALPEHARENGPAQEVRDAA